MEPLTMQLTVRTDNFISDAELIRIGDDNPAWRVERVNGGVVMSPPTGLPTGLLNSRLNRLLAEWGERHGYASIDSSTGVRMRNNDVLSPDGSLIAVERVALYAADNEEAFAPLPDLAVEVASPSDRRPALRRKCMRYHADGVRFVVMIDPREHTVETWGTPLDDLDIDWQALAAG